MCKNTSVNVSTLLLLCVGRVGLFAGLATQRLVQAQPLNGHINYESVTRLQE